MEPRTCSSCGGAVSPDLPQALCPECLLRRGLENDETTVRGAETAPSVHERDPIREALQAQLQSQYRIVRLLGRGGMGCVYLARDLTLEREVAIKVVSAESSTGEMRDRFRREARTAAKLAHPHIVPLHSFGDVGGMPYFVMGYVRGESLAARLRRDGRIPEDEARKILAEVADALDHAHRQGIVHRDVKPDNVLLDDETGRAMLTDFGIAKAAGKGETMTGLGGIVGTPHYMSPEQASGHSSLDGRSDVYSLGVMAFAMLAGRLPFEGTTASEVLSKHLTQEAPSLRSFVPSVSDATLQAIERCLAKDPSRRWADARELKLALGVAEEAQLPDSLRAVEGQGVAFTVIAAMLILLQWVVVVHFQHAPIEVLFVGATVFVVGYLAVLVRLRIEGFGFAQSQRAIWTEPSWWSLWYPRGLRRRGNVWDRLPAAVRRYRWWVPFVFVYGAVWLVDASAWFALKMVGLAGVVALGAILDFQARRQLKRSGLSGADLRNVIISAPAGRIEYWSRPHIAAILAPRASVPPRRADTPHDHLQAILEMANQLSGPLRSLGTQASIAARQLVSSIGDSDREIAALARNVEPGEEERLVEKIEALSGVEETAAMRSLLEKQLELIRGLMAKMEEAKATRARRIEMLRNLALHLASLHARTTEPPADTVPLTDRVRALCEEIARA